jgi:hypothetical protein
MFSFKIQYTKPHTLIINQHIRNTRTFQNGVYQTTCHRIIENIINNLYSYNYKRQREIRTIYKNATVMFVLPAVTAVYNGNSLDRISNTYL